MRIYHKLIYTPVITYFFTFLSLLKLHPQNQLYIASLTILCFVVGFSWVALRVMVFDLSFTHNYRFFLAFNSDGSFCESLMKNKVEISTYFSMGCCNYLFEIEIRCRLKS